MVHGTLIAKALRLSVYARLFNQPIKSAAVWWQRLENSVLPDYAADCFLPSRICARLGMIFDKLAYVVEMALTSKLH